MGNFISKVYYYFSPPSIKLLDYPTLDKSSLQISESQALAASLKGKTIHVSNVELMYEAGGWPMDQVNTVYPQLKPVVGAKISSLGFTGKKLHKFHSADLALFVSCWWPHASFEACVTIVYWIIWLFVWDDEIDLEENVVGNDFSAAQIFRQDTFKFIEYSLGFGNFPGEAPKPPNIIISSFAELGERLRAQYNERQRRRFLDEVRFYIDMTELEQETKFNDRFPTLDKFWAMRMGSSAVKPCLVMAEMAINAELPAYLREHPDMEVLWDETTISISVSNDILSLKKELRSDGVLSVIPLSVYRGMALQPAVDAALMFLQDSIDRFNTAAERIVLAAPVGTADHKAIVDYVDVLETNQTGHHYWSIRSGRYFLVGTVREDGSMDIKL